MVRSNLHTRLVGPWGVQPATKSNSYKGPLWVERTGSHTAPDRLPPVSSSRTRALRQGQQVADSRGSLCSPKAGFGRIRLLPRRAAYGLSCELTQPAMSGHSPMSLLCFGRRRRPRTRGRRSSLSAAHCRERAATPLRAALPPKCGSARSLLPVLDRQDAAGHGLDQGLMVGFGLVRVRAGEAAHGRIQLIR